MAFSSIFVIILMFVGGAGDLLSLNSTAAYWRAKGGAPSAVALRAEIGDTQKAGDVSADIAKLGDVDFKVRQAAKEMLAAKGAGIADQLKTGTESKDPDIAATCKELLEKASSGGQEKAVRKLMAIRTLGEMKDKESTAALQGLLGSKEPFVAGYAQTALDLITGESHPPAAVDISKDVELLPKDTYTVGQSRGVAGIFTLEKALDAMPEAITAQPGQTKDEARTAMIDQVTGGLMPVIEAIGNVRVDGITFGMSKNVGPNEGWVVLIARGEFDRAAVAALIKDKSAGEYTYSEEGKVPTLTGRNQIILLPSDHLAILATGAVGDEVEAIGKAIAAASKTGKGEFSQNADMAALLKTVDRSKSVWAVMQVPDLFKQELPPLAGVDTLRLEASSKGTGLHLELKGAGADAEKVKASAESMKGILADGITSLTGEIAQLANAGDAAKGQAGMMTRLVGILQGIKVDSADKGATMSGDVDVYDLAGMFFMSFGQEMRVQRAVPQPMPVPPVPRNLPQN